MRKNTALVPSLNANCFQCKSEVEIKYVVPKKKYSDKNIWYYWTENEKDKDKKICDNCLKNFYFQDKILFWETIKKIKKRELLRSYINSNTVKSSP